MQEIINFFLPNVVISEPLLAVFVELVTFLLLCLLTGAGVVLFHKHLKRWRSRTTPTAPDVSDYTNASPKQMKIQISLRYGGWDNFIRRVILFPNSIFGLLLLLLLGNYIGIVQPQSVRELVLRGIFAFGCLLGVIGSAMIPVLSCNAPPLHARVISQSARS